MEDFVLYNVLSNAAGQVIYKARRKGTITYLSISCANRHMRALISNHVRIVSDLKHPNILQFDDWYETSNHLWLVMELCTGGTLEQVLKQDGRLPESVVRKFGADIFRGLDHLHSRGIIFNDLNPNRLVLDSKGNVKLFDMSYAHGQHESLDDILNHQTDEEELMGDVGSFERPSFSNFMALETLEFGKVTPLSDYWGLGCLLYFMACGIPPYVGETKAKLIHCIKSRTVTLPTDDSKRFGNSFCDLLSALLTKPPTKRIQRNQLIKHEFWKDCLNDLDISTTTSSSTTTTSEQLISSDNSSLQSYQNGKVSGQSVSNGAITNQQHTTHTAEDTEACYQADQPNYNANKMNLPVEGANFTLHSNASPPSPSNPPETPVLDNTHDLNGDSRHWVPDSRMVQSEYPMKETSNLRKSGDNETQVRTRFSSVNLDADTSQPSLRNIAHDAKFRPCPVPMGTRCNLAVTYLWADDASYLPQERKLLLSLWHYLKGNSIDVESKLPPSFSDPLDCLANGWHPRALNEYARWVRTPSPAKVEGLSELWNENKVHVATTEQLNRHFSEIASLLSSAPAATARPTGQNSSRSSGRFARPNLSIYTKWLLSSWIAIRDRSALDTDSDQSTVARFFYPSNMGALLKGFIQQLTLSNSPSASISYRIELCRSCSLLLHQFAWLTCRFMTNPTLFHTSYRALLGSMISILPSCLTALYDLLKDSSSRNEASLRQITLLTLGEWINCALSVITLTIRHCDGGPTTQSYQLDISPSSWQTIVLHLMKSMTPSNLSVPTRPGEAAANKIAAITDATDSRSNEQYVRLAAARVLDSLVTSVVGFRLHEANVSRSVGNLASTCVASVTTRELVVRIWVDGLLGGGRTSGQRNQISQEVSLLCANTLCGIVRIQPNLFISLIERISPSAFNNLLDPQTLGKVGQQTDLVTRLLSMATMGLILPCSTNLPERTKRNSVHTTAPAFTRQMSAPTGGAGTPASCRRILSDRQFILAVLCHLKSPHAMMRSKAYLLLSAILTTIPKSSFAIIFDAHLPGLLERDLKSTSALQNRYVDLRAIGKMAHSSTLTDCSSATYLAACALHFADILLTHLIPMICEQLLISLGCINQVNSQNDQYTQSNVRRRPSYATILTETHRVASVSNLSTVNQKTNLPSMLEAKSWLPAYTSLANLLSNCLTIRVRLLLPESTRRHSDACSFCFIAFIGRLFELWTSTDQINSTGNVASGVHQPGSVEDQLLCVTLTITEDLVQYADLVEARQRDLICSVLPGLARLTAAPRARPEVRAICVKIVARLAEVILGEVNYQSSTGSLIDLLDDTGIGSSGEHSYSSKPASASSPPSQRPLSADVELLLNELNKSDPSEHIRTLSDKKPQPNDVMNQSLHPSSNRFALKRSVSFGNQKPDRTGLPSTLGSAVRPPSSAVLATLFELVNKLMLPYVDRIIDCTELTAPTAFICLLNTLLNSISCQNLLRPISPDPDLPVANGDCIPAPNDTCSPLFSHFSNFLISIHSNGLDSHLVRLLSSQLSKPIVFDDGGESRPLKLKGSVTSTLCFSLLQTIPLLMLWPKYAKPSCLIVQLRLTELVSVVCLELGDICFPISDLVTEERIQHNRPQPSPRPHSSSLLSPTSNSKVRNRKATSPQASSIRSPTSHARCPMGTASRQLYSHLLAGLQALNSLLDYVSNVVRIALVARSARTSEGEIAAKAAEEVLFAARPPPKISGLLATCIGLLHPHSYSPTENYTRSTLLDDEIRRQLCETAMACLTSYASLYGGEYCRHALNPCAAASISLCLLRLVEEQQHADSQNLPQEWKTCAYCHAENGASDNLRLLLRIIRRLVSSDQVCRQQLSNESLEDGVTNLYSTLMFVLHHARRNGDTSTAKLVYAIMRLSTLSANADLQLLPKPHAQINGINSAPTVA